MDLLVVNRLYSLVKEYSSARGSVTLVKENWAMKRRQILGKGRRGQNTPKSERLWWYLPAHQWLWKEGKWEVVNFTTALRGKELPYECTSEGDPTMDGRVWSKMNKASVRTDPKLRKLILRKGRQSGYSRNSFINAFVKCWPTTRFEASSSFHSREGL